MARSSLRMFRDQTAKNPLLRPLLCAAGVALCSVSRPAAASEPDYLTYEEPVPESVEEIGGALDGLARRPPTEEAEPIIPAPDLESPFWRDTSLDLYLRSYYLERNRDGGQDSLAWALGGWLAYRSGLWRERLSIGATVYTTQKLYGPDHKPGSGLLKPVQQGFTVLGEAYVDAKLTEQMQLRLFRYTFDLPYLNRRDIRMVPNTFEAYFLYDKTDPTFNYAIGHVTKIKTFSSDEFVRMSEAAGAEGTNAGVSTAGFYYKPSSTAKIGAIDHYGHDTFNTFFAEATDAQDLAEGLGLRLSGQFTHQKSVGDEVVGTFQTDQFGIKSDMSYAGAVLTLAYVQTGNGGDILNPWGGSPSYSSLILEDFDRAGEKAWRFGLSYDFAVIGWKGLSGFVNYASGDTPDSGRNASNDQDELDFTIDFKPPDGMLQGLWLRARAAYVDQHGDNARDLTDYRLILNYELPLL